MKTTATTPSHSTSPTVFVVAFVSVCVGVGMTGCRGGTPDAPTSKPVVEKAGLDTVAAVVGGRAVALEVADTDDLRDLGLGGRESLATDTGMIFTYLQADWRTFWMKGCRIGLDIAYLDDDRRIFQIGSLDPPAPSTPEGDWPALESTAPARYVVEMEKGWFARHGIEAGAVVEFSSELARRARETRE